MHRIDTPTAQKDKFGQGKNGFTNGDPATGRRATDLNSDMWDAVQEEVCAVIEAAGIPLSKGEHTQLHAAIGRLIDEQVKTRLEKNQNGADIPNKPLFLQNVGLEETINRAADALQKSQNGSDIPDKTAFIEHIGMKETLNPTKRVSIGNIGTGAFDGSTPSINIGDSDSGFIGSADGVLDIYCNNAKVGYIDNAGLHMLAGIATNGNVVLQNDAREHIIIQNADGTPRMFIYKDKGGDGVHLNNGNDASTEYLFHNDGSFYAPLAVRAGGSKKLAVRSDNNSALSAHFNLWGDVNRPTVIELDDDQGWHLYSQRNTDGSVVFYVNGDIHANTLSAGAAIYANNGDVFGTAWGGGNAAWLSSYLYLNMVKAIRLGPVALSGGLWRDFQLGGGQVVTGFHTDGDWEMQGGDDKVYYRPIQYLVGETWVTAPSV
ncbi:hypothetical protein ACX6OI_000682 [Salmonella enterica subsp. diarizonae serovar 65:(k):z]